MLFLLLSCRGLITLLDISGEICYRVVQLLLGVVNFHTHGLGLTLERQWDVDRRAIEGNLRAKICSVYLRLESNE